MLRRVTFPSGGGGGVILPKREEGKKGGPKHSYVLVLVKGE